MGGKENKMYKKHKYTKTEIRVNNSNEGETIEQKIIRMVKDKEPITEKSPVIYTERKDGVMPAYDIRTDRWEIAVDAMNKIEKFKSAKRDGKADLKIVKNDGKTETTDGTQSSEK